MPTDDDVPVVLLHGVGLDRTVWSWVEALLPRTASAIDLPGHGAQQPLTGPTDLAAMASDVLARMPAGQVHLVGFSLGSLVAQQIAIEEPTRVRSLACVSSVCARTQEESSAVQGRLEGAESDFRGSMERALDRWFPEDEGDSEALRDEMRPVLLANDPDSYRHAYTVFATGDRELESKLNAITAPTLAITGELDPGSTPEMSRRLARRIPDAEVAIVPGARHMLPVTHPDDLADRLENLIDLRARNSTSTSPSSTPSTTERSRT